MKNGDNDESGGSSGLDPCEASIQSLAGNYAHDINNLISTIFLNCDQLAALLKEEQVRQEREMVELLENSIQACEHYRDLNRLMQAYTGNQPLARKEIDLSEWIEQQNPDWIQACGDRNQLVVEMAESMQVEMDAQLTGEAIVAILQNAKQASAGGPIQLTFRRRLNQPSRASTSRSASTDPSNPPGDDTEKTCATDWLEIQIRDTGHGIDPAILPRVTHPYFTTRQSQRGLGLTRAVSNIRNQGGSLRIESARGVGTQIEIQLPLRSQCDHDPKSKT